MFKKCGKSILSLVCAASLAVTLLWASPVQAWYEPGLGEIKMFAGNFAPRGFALCNGQILPIAQNTALFSLLGTIYGGDGRTSFALPDLRGRVPMHFGNGPGLTPRQIGQRGGSERVTLSNNEMPSHSHGVSVTVKATNNVGNSETPGGNTWAKRSRDRDYSSRAPDVDMTAESVQVSLSNAGGSQSHENMPPHLVINYVIATVGTFPSR